MFLLRIALVALVAVLLPSCSSTEEAGGLVVPDWYIVNFKVHYQDGRIYTGQCKWPDSFDAGLAFDIKSKADMVKEGRTIKTRYELTPPKSKHYVPHGMGTMSFPDGSQQEGFWKDGAFVGTSPP